MTQLDAPARPPRSLTLDALRGWAILLVVLGHAIVRATPAFESNLGFRLIYSFHMPLLMAVSGYLAYGRIEGKLLRVVRTKALQLLVPFTMWALLAYVTFGRATPAGTLDYLAGLVVAPERGLWFLWALYFEFVALSLVTTLARRHSVVVVLAIMVVLPILPATSRFGLWEMTAYFPYFAGGWVLRQHGGGAARRLVERPWFGPVCIGLFLLAGWFWSYRALPAWLPFAPGVAQNIIWKSYRYLTAALGIAASTWLVLFATRTIPRGVPLLAWIGQRTIDVYAGASWFELPLTALVASLGLPMGGLVALFFLVPLAGSLAASALVLRRFGWSRRVLLGDWSSTPGGRLGGT